MDLVYNLRHLRLEKLKASPLELFSERILKTLQKSIQYCGISPVRDFDEIPIQDGIPMKNGPF